MAALREMPLRSVLLTSGTLSPLQFFAHKLQLGSNPLFTADFGAALVCMVLCMPPCRCVHGTAVGDAPALCAADRRHPRPLGALCSLLNHVLHWCERCHAWPPTGVSMAALIQMLLRHVAQLYGDFGLH